MPQEKTPHPVARARTGKGWSQAELACRASVPRTTLSAIEGRRLTPSVTAALALARALECSVEELFGTGGGNPVHSAWAWGPTSGTSRYWEAEVSGKRWLYPATGEGAWPHDGTVEDGVLNERAGATSRGTLLLAGCDPAVELLAAEYASATGFRLLAFPRGGTAALELLRRGQIHVAAVHRSTPDKPDANAAAVRAVAGTGYCLLRYARWEEGIAVASGSRAQSVNTIARRCDRWALREPGSAARECLDEILAGRVPAGHEARGHRAVAETVRSGWASAGICVRLSAEEAGLEFLPVRAESVDLCISESNLHDARVQGLVRLLRSRSYRRLLGDLPGYEAQHTGELSKV